MLTERPRSQAQLLKEFVPRRPCRQRDMSKTWQRHPDILALQLAWLDTPASASDILRILDGVSHSSSYPTFHLANSAPNMKRMRHACLQYCLKLLSRPRHLRQNTLYVMTCHFKTLLAPCCPLASTHLLRCLAGPEAL